MIKPSAEVRILVNGKPVKEFFKDDGCYVEGRQGSEYEIRIKNKTYFRKVLAVITVDGVNVISGEPDDVTEGYIINGGSSYVVKGFRSDMNTVGAFKFSSVDGSYCNEVGKAGNNGVIGVKIFEELPQPYCIPKYYDVADGANGNGLYRSAVDGVQSRRLSINNGSCLDNITTAGSGGNATFDCCVHTSMSYTPDTMDTEPKSPMNLGTSWGSKISDKVEEVEFKTGSCVETFVFYYASKNGLKKLGIDVSNDAKIQMPSAFGEKRFAKPPKNWK